jgi:hypothetical protein
VHTAARQHSAIEGMAAISVAILKEADSFSTCQEIPNLLSNPKVRCRVHKIPPWVAIFNEMSRLKSFTSLP